MDTRKRVMLRSTFNQPVIRRLNSENDGAASICLDNASVGITVSKGDVFEYDPELFETMLKYDKILETQPKELEELWGRAKPLFPYSK